MALKGLRVPQGNEEIGFFMNEVAERGGVVCLSTMGSGVAIDQADALLTYAASSSGKTPVGVLLQDMVDYDLTRQRENSHKDEVQKGGKVAVSPKGRFTTDQVLGTPAVGDFVFLTGSGKMLPFTSVASKSVDVLINPRVGKVYSKKDENGFCTVYFDI